MQKSEEVKEDSIRPTTTICSVNGANLGQTLSMNADSNKRAVYNNKGIGQLKINIYFVAMFLSSMNSDPQRFK